MMIFYFYWGSIPEIYIENFFVVAYKIKKKSMIRVHVSVRFKNEPHAKNG